MTACRTSISFQSMSESRWLVFVQLTIVAVTLLVTGCTPFYLPPGKTYGEIKVGKPRVTSRERLVNDRFDEEAWLKDQLSKTNDQDFGLQGKSDIRSFTGIFARAGVQADPGQIAAYRATQSQYLQDLQHQTELKNLDYQIALKKKQNDLAAVTSDPTKSSGTIYDSLSANSASGVLPTSPNLGDAITSITQGLAGIASAVPAPSGMTDTTATASPIEKFRDRLAYREEIRNEILQNALDDSHDLHGNTLYRFNFDTTVIPANDTSAWAMVNISVLPSDTPEPTPEQFAEMVNQKIEWESRAVGRAVAEVCTTLSEIIYAKSDAEQRVKENLAKCLQEESLQDALNVFPRIAISSTSGTVSFPLKPKVRGATPSATGPRLLQIQARDYADAILSYGKRENCDNSPCRLAILVTNFVAEYLAKYQLDKDTTYEFGYSGKQVASGGFVVTPNAEKNFEGFEFDNRKIKAKQGGQQDAKITVVSELYGHLRGVVDNKVNALTKKDEQGKSLTKEDAIEKVSKDIREQHIATYGATPKESVQRISEVLARREAMELALALKAVTGAASLDSTLAYVNQNDGLFHALRRQPLVVGFTDMNASDGAPSFGWLIGPKYEIKNKYNNKQQVGYRHVPIQNGVAGVVSIPVFWSKVTLCVQRYWQPEDGGTRKKPVFQDVATNSSDDNTSNKNKACPGGTVFDVDLPARPLLAFNLIKPEYGGRYMSLDNKIKKTYAVTLGQHAKLVIMGENLWRGTSVLLGGQAADKISVLPDMGGIVAEFNEIQASGFTELKPDGTLKPIDLNIVTSEGSVTVGTVTIVDPAQKKADTGKWEIRSNPFIYPGSKLKLKPDLNLASGYSDLKLTLLNGPKFDTAVGNPPTMLPTQYIDSENVDVNIPDPFKLTNGAVLQLKVEVSKVPSDAKPIISTFGNIVYYSSADAAKASYTKIDKAVTVSFPAKFKLAYPMLNKLSKVNVTVEFNANLKLPEETYECQIPTKDDKGGSCKLELSSSASNVSKVTIGNDPDKYPEALSK